MKEFWTAKRTIYPAIFRVLVGSILLFDLICTYPASDILFNPEINAFLPQTEIMMFLAENSTAFILVYTILLILFILGIGKNITSFLVFACTLLFVQLTNVMETWGERILFFTLMYFVFVDSFRFLALNKTKGKYSFISKLAIWSILLNLFLIYLNNAYFKITDKDWFNGYAVFYSFSQYSHFKDSFWYPLLSNGFISKAVGYFIILQQLLFVPLVIWKKTRYFMIILVAAIHLIMLKEFGLWKFELILILIFGFILTDDEWRRIFSKFRIDFNSK